MITPGVYKHYKGQLYEVISIARHSETLEELVVYKALYSTQFGNNSIWVRPLAMFIEQVEFEGNMVERFKLL